MKKQNIAKLVSGPLSAEVVLEGVDSRLSARAGSMVNALSNRPRESFPVALGSEAASEAGYRFLRNERLNFEVISKPHFEATARRVLRHPTALVIHDTTCFQFSGEVDREGLGWVKHTKNDKTQGFFAHFAFCVSMGADPIPLGVIGVETWVRQGPPAGRKGKYARTSDPKRESLRWGRLVNNVTPKLPRESVIHVMDREADDYAFFSEMIANGNRFISRMRTDRRLANEVHKYAYQKIVQSHAVYEREVNLSYRRQKPGLAAQRKHPARKKRTAKLAFSASTINVARPKGKSSALPMQLELNVIRVWEVDTPPGCEPIEWKLLTNEPIETIEQVIQVADHYRNRWLIEEYFKAIKSGCQFERRQLESLSTLRNALALFIPIAWQMLVLRSLGRATPNASANCVLTDLQVEILKYFSHKKLSSKPTAKEALLAVAKMGGFLGHNKDPGWIVIGRGFQQLVTYEKAWKAALLNKK